MRRYVWLALIPSLLTAAPTPEDEARAVLDEWHAAWKAKDVERAARCFADDCVIIMTEPMAGAKRARFFTRESFLDRLKQRFAQTAATDSKDTLDAISVSDNGDVFAIAESEERSRVDQRTEWFRSYNYIVLRPQKGKMLIQTVVAELAFYVPDVPPPLPNPEKK
jgi:uncharacterized protein (TIGR02246 family)